jgi:hypothetical protein
MLYLSLVILLPMFILTMLRLNVACNYVTAELRIILLHLYNVMLTLLYLVIPLIL